MVYFTNMTKRYLPKDVPKGLLTRSTAKRKLAGNYFHNRFNPAKGILVNSNMPPLYHINDFIKITKDDLPEINQVFVSLNALNKHYKSPL